MLLPAPHFGTNTPRWTETGCSLTHLRTSLAQQRSLVLVLRSRVIYAAKTLLDVSAATSSSGDRAARKMLLVFAAMSKGICWLRGEHGGPRDCLQEAVAELWAASLGSWANLPAVVQA